MRSRKLLVVFVFWAAACQFHPVRRKVPVSGDWAMQGAHAHYGRAIGATREWWREELGRRFENSRSTGRLYIAIVEEMFPAGPKEWPAGASYWPGARWASRPEIVSCSGRFVRYRWRRSTIYGDGSVVVDGRVAFHGCTPLWAAGRLVVCLDRLIGGRRVDAFVCRRTRLAATVVCGDTRPTPASNRLAAARIAVLDMATGSVVADTIVRDSARLLGLLPRRGLVLVEDSVGFLAAYSLGVRAPIWRTHKTRREERVALTQASLHGDRIVLSSDYGYRFARDARDGRIVWVAQSRLQTGSVCDVRPATVLDLDTGEYFSVRTGQLLRLLVDDDGRRLMAPHGSRVCVRSVLYSAGRWRHLASDWDPDSEELDIRESVSALDMTTGVFLWRKQVCGSVRVLLVSPDAVLALLASPPKGKRACARVVAFDSRTGRELWRVQPKAVQTAGPSVWGLGVSWDGTAIRLRPGNGEETCLSFGRHRRTRRRGD